MFRDQKFGDFQSFLKVAFQRLHFIKRWYQNTDSQNADYTKLKLGMLVVRSDLNTFRFESLQIWIPSDLNPINFESLQIWVCLLLPPISDLNPFISIFEFFLIRFRLWSSNVYESVFCFHPFLIWIPSDLNPIIYSIPSHLNPYRFEFLQIHFRRFRLWSSKVSESVFYFHPFQIWIPSDLNPFRIESFQNFYI